MLRSPPFCYFASVLIVSLTLFISKSYSSRDLTIFMISFISPFEIISVVPEPKMFFWIASSDADAVVSNPKGS